MAQRYLIPSGPMQTTASFATLATGTNIVTLLQVKPLAILKVIEWGVSFDASAAATPGKSNQNTALQTAQFNANAGLDRARLGLSAGAQMGALSDQELSQAMQRAGALNQAGQQQRTIQQQMNDAAYEEFLRQIAYPQQQQNIRNAALGMIPLQQTSTQVTKQPAGLGGLGSLLQGAAAIAPYVLP